MNYSKIRKRTKQFEIVIGLKGFQLDNVFIVQLFKKPRNGELCELKKWFIHHVSKIRICVGQAIRGIKRFRIVKEK